MPLLKRLNRIILYRKPTSKVWSVTCLMGSLSVTYHLTQVNAHYPVENALVQCRCQQPPLEFTQIYDFVLAFGLEPSKPIQFTCCLNYGKNYTRVAADRACQATSLRYKYTTCILPCLFCHHATIALYLTIPWLWCGHHLLRLHPELRSPGGPSYSFP